MGAPQTSALVPAVIRPEIPNDNTLSTLYPSRLDWSALAASVEGLNGKELVGMGKLGESIAQQLADEDKEIKDYLLAFKLWWQNEATIKIYIPILDANIEVPVQPLIALGDQLDKVRLNEERLCKDARYERSRLAGERDIEVKRLAAIEQAWREGDQAREAAVRRQRDLDALEAQRKAAAEAEQSDVVAEVEANIKEVKATPITPIAVSTMQVKESIFKAPAGRARKDVCWRRVERDLQGRIFLKKLQQHFAFLGSENGASLLSSICRVSSKERASDEILLSYAALKKDLTTEYPGLKNEAGSEG